MRASATPSVSWFETWNMWPSAAVPSPQRPRTVKPILPRPLAIGSISFCSTRPGRCIIALARMPVPTLVGQLVR